MRPPLLSAPHPSAWFDTHLAAWSDRHADAAFGEADQVWLTVEDLVADDHAQLRRVHALSRRNDDAPSVTAAKWVACCYAGRLAQVVGFVHAFASAAVLVRPELLRFAAREDGWSQRVDLGDVDVAVAQGHPWQGQVGVRTVSDDAELAELAVSSLAAAVGPLLEATRRLGKVGLRALWAEIGDAFALTCLHAPDLPVDPAAVERVLAALHSPSAPWRTLPDLYVATGAAGPAYVGRKAGCCLAFRAAPEHAEADPDERERVWRERFPPEPSGKAYCESCSVRDLADCEERQLFWHEQERAESRRRTTTAGH